MPLRLKAPFPWFGGKSRVAHLVWPRFGNVGNYVEPFAGSLAILLKRPHEPRSETVNDLDCYLANFWRATQQAPQAVAEAADWPVNEADLHARHQWLHAQAEFREQMHSDPDYYDAKIAGWWAWGLSAWIGDNWCRVGKLNEIMTARPALRSQGCHSKKLNRDGTGIDGRRPCLGSGQGIHRKRSDMKRGGRGVQSQSIIGKPSHKRPNISGWGDKGVHQKGLSQQIPYLKNAPQGIHAKYTSNLYEYFAALSARLRRVRVCCGQWHRILGPSPTIHIGTTAVFLDPPYGDAKRDRVYNHDSLELAGDVRAWCVEHGDEPKLRIALCGYEGEHKRPLQGHAFACCLLPGLARAYFL